MDMSCEQLMENAFVISIDKIRHKAFLDAFKAAGFEKLPTLVDGFKIDSYPSKMYNLPALKSPILGNGFTHASIVKWGKTFDKDFVCIFEDDAFPCENAREKLEYYLHGIPDDCGLLKLGHLEIYGKSEQLEFVSDGKYIKGLKTYGCHAYIVFKRYYETYFELFEKNLLCNGRVFNQATDMIYNLSENLIVQKYTPTTLTRNINKNTIMHKYDGIESFQPEKISIEEINRCIDAKKAEAKAKAKALAIKQKKPKQSTKLKKRAGKKRMADACRTKAN